MVCMSPILYSTPNLSPKIILLTEQIKRPSNLLRYRRKILNNGGIKFNIQKKIAIAASKKALITPKHNNKLPCCQFSFLRDPPLVDRLDFFLLFYWITH